MLRLLSAVATTAAAHAPQRALWTRVGKYRGPAPYSKTRVKAQRPQSLRAWPSLNHPRLTAKFLRYAERIARELGVADEVAAFEKAAAEYPNPPRLVAATCVALPLGIGGSRSGFVVRVCSSAPICLVARRFFL